MIRLAAAILVSGAIAVSGALALAHVGATGVVKERMDLMDGVGEQMKTLSKIFKGERAYDPATVEAAATYIRDQGGARMADLFPEGSLDEPTEALPAIWADWERFESLARQLADAAEALARTADRSRSDEIPIEAGSRGTRMGDRNAGPSAILVTGPPRGAFIELARTCRSCHTEFRADEGEQ